MFGYGYKEFFFPPDGIMKLYPAGWLIGFLLVDEAKGAGFASTGVVELDRKDGLDNRMGVVTIPKNVTDVETMVSVVEHELAHVTGSMTPRYDRAGNREFSLAAKNVAHGATYKSTVGGALAYYSQHGEADAYARQASGLYRRAYPGQQFEFGKFKAMPMYDNAVPQVYRWLLVTDVGKLSSMDDRDLLAMVSNKLGVADIDVDKRKCLALLRANQSAAKTFVKKVQSEIDTPVTTV